MTTAPEHVYQPSILELMDNASITLVPATTPFTVWSVTQYKQFAHFFSTGLGQLHSSLDLLSLGRPLPRGSDMLAMTLLNQVRAMSHFLQRKYCMVQELEGLARVVETDSSKTWYALQDTTWLRKALKDLTEKCDAVISVVNEICRVAHKATLAPPSVGPWTVARSKAATPVLRSYNSFSSIGSEAAAVPLRSCYNTQDTTLASTPLTGPSNDGSSTGFLADLGTGRTSFTSNTPYEASVEDGDFASPTILDTAARAPALHGYDGRLSSTLQDLLELNLGYA